MLRASPRAVSLGRARPHVDDAHFHGSQGGRWAWYGRLMEFSLRGPRPVFPGVTGLWALLTLLILGLSGCGNYYCNGPNCDCRDRRECIIDCQGRGCDIECSHTAESCGAICRDDCRFECSSTNHCTSFSGEGSVIECHNSPSCASECGNDCLYVASDLSELHLVTGSNSIVRVTQVAEAEVEVGSGSEVECTGVSGCHLVCRGPCDFVCSKESGVATCDLDCRGGTRALSGNGGCE